MKVKEVMTREVKACALTESLADAAKVMWDYDCGILPVVKDGKTVVGLITDRDICMAAATTGRTPSSISVEEVMTGQVYSTMPEDDVRRALETMQKQKVRRLPVVGPEGELKGILSMNDIVLQAKGGNARKPSQLNYADVVTTYKAICEHPLPMTAAAAK